MVRRLFVLTAVAAVTACSPGEAGSSAAASHSADGCPPEVGGGVLVNQRVDWEEALPFTQWRDDYPPLECAGALAPLIPAMPEGYALAPTVMTRPPIMGDDHVAMILGQPPEPRTTPDGNAIAPTETLIFEIIRYTSEEMATIRQWFDANPDGYVALSIKGRDIIMAPAGATFVPGRTKRIGAGMTQFLGENLIVQVSYTGMFDDQRSGALEQGETDGARLMLEILDTAEAEGLL